MGDIAIAFNANGVGFLSPGLQRDVATLGCDVSPIDNPVRVELLDVEPDYQTLTGFSLRGGYNPGCAACAATLG